MKRMSGRYHIPKSFDTELRRSLLRLLTDARQSLTSVSTISDPSIVCYRELENAVADMQFLIKKAILKERQDCCSIVGAKSKAAAAIRKRSTCWA